MNRIKELFENLITFFRKDHPPKAVAEEVPDTEPLRQAQKQASLSASLPSFLAPLPFDQDSPDHWARL